MLFQAAEINRDGAVQALITPTTKGFRDALRNEGKINICFVLAVLSAHLELGSVLGYISDGEGQIMPDCKLQNNVLLAGSVTEACDEKNQMIY